MRHYRDRQALPDYEWEVLRDEQGEPLIERPFELPLGVLDINTRLQLPDWPQPQLVKSIHVAWSGKIDLIANVAHRNRVVDHKTTSIAGDNYIPKLHPAPIRRSAMCGRPVSFGAASTSPAFASTLFTSAGRSPAPSALSPRVPEAGQPPLDFFRAQFEYCPQRLDQWEANSMTLAEDFVHCLVRRYFPMFTNSCFNKYGRCQYHDICTLDDPAVRQRMLASDMYRDVTGRLRPIIEAKPKQ